MSVEGFPATRSSRPSGLSREEIEQYLARGRRARSDAFAAAAARVWRALRRFVENQPGGLQGYRVAGKP